MNFFDELVNYDKEVFDACELELTRQRHNIELIASENIVSKAVLLAAGTVLTNKYAEGFPGKRYYGGCQYVDIVEDIARERAKKLFGAEHANVQPHCGASANLATAIVTLTGKTFGIFIGQNRSRSQQNRLRNDVLGCDQLNVVTLTVQLQFTRIKHFFVIVYKFIKKVHFFSPLGGTEF